MQCEKTQHPGSVSPCQPSETGLAVALAKVAISATCRSAEFVYPTRLAALVKPQVEEHIIDKAGFTTTLGVAHLTTAKTGETRTSIGCLGNSTRQGWKRVVAG